MNNSYQIYLKLKRCENGQVVKQLLQETGFIIFKQVGSNPRSFRNYYFQRPESPHQVELHFRILPNETKISTITVQLYFSCSTATIKSLFAQLALLQKILPFQLLDLELRNRNYSELYKNKQFAKRSKGISKDQQDKAERTSYIPINFHDFIKNTAQVEKRQQFFLQENIRGERAPNDMADRPRAKSS